MFGAKNNYRIHPALRGHREGKNTVHFPRTRGRGGSCFNWLVHKVVGFSYTIELYCHGGRKDKLRKLKSQPTDDRIMVPSIKSGSLTCSQSYCTLYTIDWQLSIDPMFSEIFLLFNMNVSPCRCWSIFHDTFNFDIACRFSVNAQKQLWCLFYLSNTFIKA